MEPSNTWVTKLLIGTSRDFIVGSTLGIVDNMDIQIDLFALFSTLFNPKLLLALESVQPLLIESEDHIKEGVEMFQELVPSEVNTVELKLVSLLEVWVLDYSIPSNSATELKEMLKHKWHKQGLYS
jgi:hypothetical protein